MYNCITDRTIYNSTSAQILESPIGENSVLQVIKGVVVLLICFPAILRILFVTKSSNGARVSENINKNTNTSKAQTQTQTQGIEFFFGPLELKI